MHDLHRAGRPSRRVPSVSTLRAAAAGVGVLLAAVATVSVATAGQDHFAQNSKPAPPPAASRSSNAPVDRGVSAVVAPMAKSAPVRVQIPAVGIDSSLVSLGLLPDGTMQTPRTGFPAGWYTGAPTPGQRGPAIIAGHVDWAGHPGVFYNLRVLRPGDQVIVARADRTAAVFQVRRVAEFAKAAFPTGAVYGNLDHAGLRLITCGGSFDQRAQSYRDDIVAFADLVGARPA